ncbi:hypothetical protein Ddc_10210 [Ditylenchus destructor]|nr:hypothetical protein Ddc_10210 [Ditylenchus destructor]
MKKLKRRIPVFYLATLTCVIVQCNLVASFLAGQYYSGSCPLNDFNFLGVKWGKASEKRDHISLTDYQSYADKLQLALDLHLKELYKSMQSPYLEVRENYWKYKHKEIDAAFQNHSNLKYQHVTRDMPSRINYPPIDFKLQTYLQFSLVANILFIGIWAIQEGSIWQPCQFVKYYLP